MGERTSTLRAEVIALDPLWTVTSKNINEYEISLPDGGTRIFKGQTSGRGVYGEFASGEATVGRWWFDELESSGQLLTAGF